MEGGNQRFGLFVLGIKHDIQRARCAEVAAAGLVLSECMRHRILLGHDSSRTSCWHYLRRGKIGVPVK
jgi:hypothetical protein